MFRRVPALLALSLLATGAMLAAPGAALASCMAPPPLEEAVENAEIVFVGTVVETAERNTWASVKVEEIWKGPDQAASVVIKGGPGGNAATSVDRTFEAGVKYIFFPSVDPAVGLTDNSCTNTQPWAEAMVALRPGEPRAPIAETNPPGGGDGMDLAGFVGPVVLVLVVFGVLLGIGLLARGRHDA